MTGEEESPVSWRVITRGEASPRRHSLDEAWLRDSTISDVDMVCCVSPGTEELGHVDARAEFSRFANPAMSILILIPRKPAPELGQRWDGDVRSFIASVGLLRAFIKTNPTQDCSCYNLLYWALNNRSHPVGFECLQVPIQSKSPRGSTLQNIAVQWIIPHKGPLFMLETCFWG